MTNAFHSTSGGVATSYRALFEHANAIGRPIRLVVPAERESVEEVGEFGRIYKVAAPKSPAFDRRYRTIIPVKFLFARSGPIWEILNAEQPDLLEVRDKFCLNWIGGIFRKEWQKGIKRPVLVASSCERTDDQIAAYVSRAKFGARFSKTYMRYCYIPLFDYHLANSQYTASEIKSAMAPPHERPLFVCTEGVDCKVFNPTRRDEDLRSHLLQVAGGGSGSVLLLYSGRLSPEKNVSLLVELMERLSQDPDRRFRLVIAGEGPLYRTLEEQLSERAAGCSVMLGHLKDRDELARLYASCDVFVHPNPREPFGIAPLEAMASGLALVAPKSGGVLSYANQSNSWLVPPEGQAFHDAVLQSADPETRRRKAAEARATAEQFDWPVVASRLFTLYDRFIETGTGSSLDPQSIASCQYG